MENENTELIGFFTEGDLASTECSTVTNAQNITTTICRFESQYLAQYLFFVFLVLITFVSIKVFYLFYGIGKEWTRRSDK